MERDKGYEFIMEEVAKVYKDDVTKNSNFVGSKKEEINDDVVQTN